MRFLHGARRATILVAALGLAAGCSRCGAGPDRAPEAGVELPPSPLIERARQVDLRTAVSTALPNDRGVHGLIGRAGLLLQFATPDPEQALAQLERGLVARGYHPPMPGARDAGTDGAPESDAGSGTEALPNEGSPEGAGTERSPVTGTWAAEPPGTLVLTQGRYVIEASAAPPGLHVSVDLPLFRSDLGRLKQSPASLTSDDLARELPRLAGATEVERAFRVDLTLMGKATTLHRLLERQTARLTESGWSVLEARTEGPADGGEGEGHQTRLQRSGTLDSLSLAHRGTEAEVRYLQPLQVGP